MEIIHLNIDGKILKKGKEIQTSPIGFLGQTIELAEGFKLISFFKMLGKYRELLQLGDVLESFLEIVEKQEQSIKDPDIEFLIFYKTIEMKGFPGKPGLNIYNSLKGMVNHEPKDLKFYHLETLLDSELKLGELKHVVFGDKEDVFSYESFYSLFEFIEGISWQLSFNFNPLQCTIRR